MQVIAERTLEFLDSSASQVRKIRVALGRPVRVVLGDPNRARRRRSCHAEDCSMTRFATRAPRRMVAPRLRRKRDRMTAIDLRYGFDHQMT